MKLVLLRHTESEKNTQRSFSSCGNTEILTKQGIVQAEEIATAIWNYSQKNNLLVKTIYTADSERAKNTGLIISKKFQIGIKAFPELISVTTDNSLVGKTEQEIQQINPTFMAELNLYRAGIFNAYNYSTVAETIKSGEYEKTINSTINSIISDNEETLKVIVLHYSSLTAAMIYFARVGYNYPNSFYGKIESTLGNLFLLDIDKEKCRIELADVPPSLLDRIKY